MRNIGQKKPLRPEYSFCWKKTPRKIFKSPVNLKSILFLNPSNLYDPVSKSAPDQTEKQIKSKHALVCLSNIT